jgi:hypothetical protein
VRRVVLAGLSFAVVVAILTATVALATEQWPVALARDSRPIAARAAHRRSTRIVVQVDSVTAACAATLAVAVILSVAVAPRRFPTLR